MIDNNLKWCREELEMTQEELGIILGASKQTISNWENEKSYPDVNSLILLSEVFQTSIDKEY